ncbi:hypothetical protein acdb102_01950 [Acidothermaceae bacterium B102]|nr:hypothetical protein acdb102_01950 [Acidothermaceae bacterium B102]
MTPPATDTEHPTTTGRLTGPLLDSLLQSLLAARTQPAADQFDDVVAAAVSEGTLPADLARQLRYWQRASVHEVTDHVRSVLPAVLPVALDAVTTSADDARRAAAAAVEVWSGRDDGPADPPVRERHQHPAPSHDVPVAAEAVLSAPDVIALPAEADQPAETDHARSSQHARRRLFVAGLTSTA